MDNLSSPSSQLITVGDTVRLRTGTAHIKVTHTARNRGVLHLWGDYIKTGCTIDGRKASDFVRIDKCRRRGCCSCSCGSGDPVGYLRSDTCPDGDYILFNNTGTAREEHYRKKDGEWQYFVSRDGYWRHFAGHIHVPRKVLPLPREKQVWDQYLQPHPRGNTFNLRESIVCTISDDYTDICKAYLAWDKAGRPTD